MALDEAQNVPRGRVQTDHAMLHIMAAAAKSLGVMGAKVYATSRKGPTHVPRVAVRRQDRSAAVR